MKLRLTTIFLLAFAAWASLRAGNRNTYPLPEDRGSAGTYAALKKLPVYAHVLYTTAHPDDESAGTLTWLAREAHATTALFCLTRGDGGQNILGDEKYEALGLVRTGELLEACRIYGAEPYFSTAFEFGFSKSAEETFAKWGHEVMLEEMVRFIRRFRPSVIISAFQGNASDGHGHHQAAGILTREAFRAAGDANRFEQQKAEGLFPWQARELFVRTGRGGSEGNHALGVPVGDYDPVLGRSPREIGAEGYSKHRSQGNGAVFALPGRSREYLALTDSTLGDRPVGSSIFDGIETSLLGILDLAGSERDKISHLKEDLTAVQKCADEALAAFYRGRQEDCAAAAARGGVILNESLRRVAAAPLPKSIEEALTAALREKLSDFGNAVNAVLGVYLIARADDPTAVEGERVPVTLSFFNRGPASIEFKQGTLEASQGASIVLPSGDSSAVPPGESRILHGVFPIALGTPATEPFWYRENPNDNIYHTRPTVDVFAPFGRPVLSARVTYSLGESAFTLTVPVRAQGGDPLRGSDFIELQIVPSLSVVLQPALAIIPISKNPQTREFQVSILGNKKDGSRGVVRLLPPGPWRVEPAEAPFSISRKGETFTTRFTVHIPDTVAAGPYTVAAIASDGEKKYRRGFRVISYPENWTRNIYSPAESTAKIFDVKIAPNLTVGYVPGAGDDVPAALDQLGVHIEKLSPSDLAFGRLDRFSAIVTGIRAYNVNEDLRANNPRLLNYVNQGGTLIVQYVRPLERSAGAAARFPYGPYPMDNSDEARITVEDSPVEILQPRNPVFTTPNKINVADFEGWVQERGLYFMTDWDPHYTALLSGHDPGEPARKGGMLITRYGKGYYIYTGYAWFRQLPAGVPGAYRIFANMLSLGKKAGE